MSQWAVYLKCAILLIAISLTSPLAAAIYSTGDVNPADPSTWDSSTYAFIGKTGTGSVTADGDTDLFSQNGYLGYNLRSEGVVTVEGVGSSWNLSKWLSIGHMGNGKLQIKEGGSVTTGYDTTVAKYPGSSGEIYFNNGTLTSRSLLCACDDITGSGTINIKGLVSDVDLVFDTTHGLKQTFITKKNSSQNITINLDVDGSGIMGAGYGDVGAMSISEGIALESFGGYIGYKPDSEGFVTVDGPGSTWNTNSPELKVGHYGNGTLHIKNGGAIQSNSSYIAYESSSTGGATVEGSHSTWNNTFCLSVGHRGHGTLNIKEGGTVVSKYGGFIGWEPGSRGEVTVDGTGSTLSVIQPFNVGSFGNGILNITRGGFVKSNSGTIGDKFGSTGVVMVDGTGSSWQSSGRLHVGSYGNGYLFVTNGGTVSNRYGGSIGFELGSKGKVTVDGAGSTWTNTGQLSIGLDGNGTLNISNEGKIHTEICKVGYGSYSTGEATVDGTGSAWINESDLFVGYYGTGKLTLSNGGVVCSNSKNHIGYKSDSSGEVSVDGAGSIWTNSDLLYVGNDGAGTLTINEDGLVSVGSTLWIDKNGDSDSFINMSTGGVLALFGETDASGSIDDFLGLVEGTDAIRYWDGLDWAHISGATEGEDYWLEYRATGDLAGYTMLTVGVGVVPVPEPSTIALILVGLGTLLAIRRRR